MTDGEEEYSGNEPDILLRFCVMYGVIGGDCYYLLLLGVELLL